MKKIFTLIAAITMAVSANAQEWKVTSDIIVDGIIEAGSVLADNDLVKATSNFAAKAGNILVDDAPATVKYDDNRVYDMFTQIRTANNVSAANPQGDDNGGSMTLLVEAKANTSFTIYYRRQAVSGAFAAADGKDLKCFDVTGNASNPGELTVSSKTEDEAYGYVYQTFSLSAGHSYTFWAKGTTIQLYGFAAEALKGTIAEKESWESDATSTNDITLNSITVSFLNNTSKGSTPDAGTWTFAAGSAKGDQNSMEVQFTPSVSGKLTIFLAAKLANNKTINMLCDGIGVAGQIANSSEVVESGACAVNELPAGTGIEYNVEAGKVYNFYCGGTKWACQGFTFEPGTSDGIATVAVANAAVKTVKAIENGRLVIKTAKATYNVAGAIIK